jgi:hypothetical protein
MTLKEMKLFIESWDFHEEQPVKPGAITETIGDWLALRCPNCGFNYTHLRSVRGVGQLSERFSQIPCCEIENNIALLFECEGCSDAFELIFRQHKGNTFLTSRKISPPAHGCGITTFFEDIEGRTKSKIED